MERVKRPGLASSHRPRSRKNHVDILQSKAVGGISTGLRLARNVRFMYDALVQFISTQETFFALGSSLYGREKNSFRPRAFPYSEVAFAYSEVADGNPRTR